MGIVPFHLGLRRPGQLRWIDRLGLTTSDVVTCPALGNVPRSALGAWLSYREYFARLGELEATCDLPRPDVLFELDKNEELVRVNGYSIVYRQPGRRRSPSRFHATRVEQGQFVAVRNDLFGSLGQRDYPRIFRWPEDE